MGGAAAIIDPQNPLGVPAELLNNSPFEDYLIPGIILFFLLGVGNLAGAVAFRYDEKRQGYFGLVMGTALAVWIIVQCVMIESIVAIHGVFFLIGIIKMGLSARILAM